LDDPIRINQKTFWIKQHTFLFKQSGFFPDGGSRPFSLETSQVVVAADDTMAGDFGCEGISFEGLTDGLSRAATKGLGEEFVSGHPAFGNMEECVIDFLLEEGWGALVFHEEFLYLQISWICTDKKSKKTFSQKGKDYHEPV